MTSKRGATLIELLIVVAIIFIVMTMLVVTMGRVYAVVKTFQHSH